MSKIHQQTILFDVDSTLANINHRRAYVMQRPPNWAKFNREMGHDIPNEPIVSLYKNLWNSKIYDLIIVTGRHEKYRKITETWFHWNEIPFSQILMRPDNDNRADHIIKEEILDSLLADGKEIAFTVDDRQQVVDMWRRRGITCLQCDVGDF